MKTFPCGGSFEESPSPEVRESSDRRVCYLLAPGAACPGAGSDRGSTQTRSSVYLMDRRLGRYRSVRCEVWRPGTRTAGQGAGTPRATRPGESLLARLVSVFNVVYAIAQCRICAQW